MVQLEFLNGEEAGRQFLVRRFPFCAGRSPGTHLQLQGKGVWDQHLAMTVDRDGSVRAIALPGALITVNGQSVQEAVLASGDVLGLGALQLRFSLSPAAQRGLQLRESFLWIILLFLWGAQAATLYWLLG